MMRATPYICYSPLLFKAPPHIIHFILTIIHCEDIAF